MNILAIFPFCLHLFLFASRHLSLKSRTSSPSIRKSNFWASLFYFWAVSKRFQGHLLPPFVCWVRFLHKDTTASDNMCVCCARDHMIGILWGGNGDLQLTPMIDPGAGISACAPVSSLVHWKAARRKIRNLFIPGPFEIRYLPSSTRTGTFPQPINQ